MKTELFPTQREDVEKYLGLEDLPNFSKAGTGKTITAIAAVEALKLQSGLVVCPTIAQVMWEKKLEEELGAKVQRLETGRTEIDKTADFIVCTYGLIKPHFDSLLSRDNDALICDESHRLKGPDSQRTKAVFGDEHDGEGGLYESSQYCLTLTGTPIERYADDLWSQLRATQPDALYKYGALTLDAFQRQFCRMELKEYAEGAVLKRVSVANQNEALLNRMLYKDIGAIRRTIADVAPYMPPVSFREIFVQHKVDRELVSLLGGKTSEKLIQAVLDGDQAVAKARRLLGMAKLTHCISYIADEARSDQLLVGYWHTEVGMEIVEQLNKQKHVEAERIGGDAPIKRREEIKRRFQEGTTNVIVGQMGAMGEAMDGLQQACRRVIIVEDDWSSSRIEQFYKRIARAGQKLPVIVDFLHADHELEEAIIHVRERKEHGIGKILG